MPPLEVAVLSEGTVVTSVTGWLVARVIGTKTVSFVVGGSAVDVIVYIDVVSKVFVSVLVKITVLPAETVV